MSKEGICREYLRERPFDVNAIRLLAEIGIKLRIFDDAINLLERCLELAPDFHVARANYATALARYQRFSGAIKQTARLKREQPDNISHKVQHASILSMAGEFEEAHRSFEEVLQDIPDNAGILTSYGHSLRYGGKGSASAEAYLRAISADATAGEAYWSLANLKTFRFPDKQVAQMRTQLASLDEASENKYHLAFALGKALEDKYFPLQKHCKSNAFALEKYWKCNIPHCKSVAEAMQMYWKSNGKAVLSITKA